MQWARVANGMHCRSPMQQVSGNDEDSFDNPWHRVDILGQLVQRSILFGT